MSRKKTALKKKPVKKKRQPKPLYLVCIGASAGGLNAVIELISQLPANVNAAVMIALHLSKVALGDLLTDKMKRSTSLSCCIATHNEKIKAGTIYLAPPGVHLLVRNDHIVIGHGPPENRFRPSIDVLFRSAAAHFGERAIGIVLTGLLNDGTSGMWAIRESGGTCIVQDPNEAEYPDMPISVLETMEVDHCISLKKMGALITSIARGTKLKGVLPPPAVIAESRLSEDMATGIEKVRMLGEKTEFACPDCGGGLWQVGKGEGSHLRCHIGHVYSANDLVIKQSESIEMTLWIAVRMMEERKLFLSRLAKEHLDKGLAKLSTSYREQVDHLAVHVDKMKKLLYSIHQE